FSEAIASATLAASDVSFSGPHGAISISGISATVSNTFRVSFTSQTTSGIYSLTLGPDVSDLAGNLMNQNNNATNGESVADAFTGQFILSLADLAVTGIVIP